MAIDTASCAAPCVTHHALVTHATYGFPLRCEVPCLVASHDLFTLEGVKEGEQEQGVGTGRDKSEERDNCVKSGVKEGGGMEEFMDTNISREYYSRRLHYCLGFIKEYLLYFFFLSSSLFFSSFFSPPLFPHFSVDTLASAACCR